MTTIQLLRHAKSSWAEPGVADHDRPLNRRGREAAPQMGRFIAKRLEVPALILCSTARRARETLGLVFEGMGEAPEARLTRAIYEAEAGDLIDLLRDAGDPGGPVMLIGHNPAIEDCADALAGPESEADAAQRMAMKFPTAGLAVFECDGPPAPGAARLTHFQVPRDFD